MTIEMYGRYRTALEEMPPRGRMVTYEWGKLPQSMSFVWMPYRDMFDEFSREIANSVNELTDYANRLMAWEVVIASMTDLEKMDAAHEFIDPLATISLNLPYVIRSRFIFAIAHLCHQANRSHDDLQWRDDLPLDQEIFFKEADKYGAGWAEYKSLKRCVEALGNKTYQLETRNFRNAYNHRFSPRVVIGMTQMVTREVNPQTKSVSYTFGSTPALTVGTVVELLTQQLENAYACFESFQRLIREQELSISRYQLRHPT